MQTENKEFFGLAYDRIFKAVALNKEKDYRYLSLILSDILEEEINVTYAEAFEVKVTNALEKVKILDILANTKTDEIINIELNSSFNKSIIERNIIYYFSLISSEFKHINENKKIKKIFQINLNFHKVGKELNEIFYENFEIINVNVLKYKKSCYDKNIKGDLEHIYLVSLGSDKEELKKLGNVDRLVKKVGNKVFELNEDEKIRDQIERERDAEIVYHNGLKYAKEDGHDEGVKDEKISIAKNLLRTNKVSIKLIAQVTELTEEEVLKIKNEIVK